MRSFSLETFAGFESGRLLSEDESETMAKFAFLGGGRSYL